MLLANSFAGPQFVLLALLGLTTAFLLRRGHRRRTQMATGDPVAEVRRGVREHRMTENAEIQRLEARLYDFGREIDGRVETTFAVLDRLIAAAEDEITRLESALEASRQVPARPPTVRLPDVLGPMHRPLSAQDRRMIAHLAAAGYDVAGIAHLTGRTASEVATVIGDGAQSEAA